MARVRVVYWKEIPVQIQAQDDDGQSTMPLDPRFQEAADAIAMFDGSAGSDAYLDGWGYGPYAEVDGAAEDVAKALAAQFNSGMPSDFVARIRDLQKAGKRDGRPGVIDSWAGVDLFSGNA